MSADPPWLDEAAAVAEEVYLRADTKDCPYGFDRIQWRAAVRAVLAFAARQPHRIVKPAERDREMARECEERIITRLREGLLSIGLSGVNPVPKGMVEYIATFLARAREEGRREPRPITDALVEAATHGICRANPTSGACCKCGFGTDYQCGLFSRYSSDARAALEAAEKARTTPPPVDDVLGEAHMRRPNPPYLPG